MLAEERFAQILALMAEKRTATVQELCEALNASESTIRRDLNELDRLGKVNKVHGGATLPDSQFRADEPTMAAKESLAVAEKRAIANAAAALITAEDFVYLDAGSTTLALARAISGPALDAAYVTNGVAHARLLAQKGCRVCLPGGLLRPRQRPSSGRQRCRACSSTTSPKPLWEPTAWRWTQASPRRTPRKRLSRLRPSGGRGKPGSSWMTPSSPASTRRSSPSCTAGQS